MMSSKNSEERHRRNSELHASGQYDLLIEENLPLISTILRDKNIKVYHHKLTDRALDTWEQDKYQDILLNICKSVHRWNSERGCFGTFVKWVVRDQTFKAWYYSSREKRSGIEVPINSDDDWFGAYTQPPVDLRNLELREILEERIPNGRDKTITRRVLDGEKFSEISKDMGINRETCRVGYLRVAKRLSSYFN